MNDADDPMSFFTSAVPNRFNKPWFFDICQNAITEGNRALERFKRESTEGILNANHIVRAKARGDIRYSKKHLGRKCFISRRTQHILFTVIWTVNKKC